MPEVDLVRARSNEGRAITETTAYMLDTNVFNEFCDGSLPLACLRGRRLLVTGIQEAELWNCEDEARRNALRDTFEKVNADWEPAAQFVFEMAGAGFDRGSWGATITLTKRCLFACENLRALSPARIRSQTC
jgi:hypothetical protein